MAGMREATLELTKTRRAVGTVLLGIALLGSFGFFGIRGSRIADREAVRGTEPSRPRAMAHPAVRPERPVPGEIRVPILVYHTVAPHRPGQTREQREFDVDTRIFEQQMQYLVDHQYRVIPLAELVDALEGKDSVPSSAVVITFDDGWVSQYQNAFPVLRRLGLTAAFFIYSDAIGTDPVFMTWDHLREMQSAGMTIESHSRSHADLRKPGVSLAGELRGSRDVIERKLGTVPEFFAYPYGASNERIADAVRSAGYRAARTFPGGASNSAADLFVLRSVLTTDDMAAFVRVLGTLK